MTTISASEIWFWRALGFGSMVLLFAGAGLFYVSLRHRRWAVTALSVVLEGTVFLLLQTLLSIQTYVEPGGPSRGALVTFLVELVLPHPIQTFGLFVLLAVCQFFLWQYLLRYDKRHITPMSVKEALDDLPMGVCAWLPGGRIVLINHEMERLGRTITGGAVLNGALLRTRLEQDQLQPGYHCLAVGEALLLHLPSGSVRALSFRTMRYEQKDLTILLVSEITEAYQKTLELKAGQRKLAALSRRLADYNQQIVDLTAQEEILRARIRIHDQIGADLLIMRKLILGKGTAAEAEAVRARLRQNIRFLQQERDTGTMDEVELMLQTARGLGIRVELVGRIPLEEPFRHIVATGIHECFTNILRHAHGDRLQLQMSEDDGAYHARFIGSGKPPEGEIREKGGLGILRDLTQRCGGTMRVSVRPEFTVDLDLPKEAAYV